MGRTRRPAGTYSLRRSVTPAYAILGRAYHRWLNINRTSNSGDLHWRRVYARGQAHTSVTSVSRGTHACVACKEDRVDTRDAAGLPRICTFVTPFSYVHALHTMTCARVQCAWRLRVRPCKASSSSRLVTSDAALERAREPHAGVTCRFRAFAITFMPHPNTFLSERAAAARSYIEKRVRERHRDICTFVSLEMFHLPGVLHC